MKRPLVIVTGGTGYIGSHTVIELLEHGFDVVSIDNFSRSSSKSLELIKTVTGREIKNYEIDLCKFDEVSAVFEELGDISGIIHFAAFKSVPESVSHPELYYENNIFSLVNVLKSAVNYKVNNFVFSSSCSVYGDIKKLPVSEDTILSKPKSAYAATKIMGERIVEDTCRAYGLNAICLRYFNPVGSHASGQIGEMPLGIPDNLVPVITQTAIGKRDRFAIFGGNLPTKDGTCIRDYVHVSDIARAHVSSLQYMQDKDATYEIINLGTGSGVSVLEAVNAFERVTGVEVNYTIGDPRDGDVIEIYSNIEKATELLGWVPKYGIDDMMLSAWKWELALAKMSGREIVEKAE